MISVIRSVAAVFLIGSLGPGALMAQGGAAPASTVLSTSSRSTDFPSPVIPLPIIKESTPGLLERSLFGLVGGVVGGTVAAGISRSEESFAVGYFLGAVAGVTAVNAHAGELRFGRTLVGGALGAIPLLLAFTDGDKGPLVLVAIATIPLGAAVASEF